MGRLVRALLLAFSVAVLALTAADLAVHTPPGERALARALEGMLSGPGRSVAIEGLRLGWPFDLGADEIVAADAAGVWLRVERPRLDLRPIALLGGRIDVERLAAGRVEVRRKPEAGPASGSVSLPLAVRVGEAVLPLDLPSVHLDIRGHGRIGHRGGVVDLVVEADDGSRATLAGRFRAAALALRWQVSVPDLGRWRDGAAGRLTAAGTVGGDLWAPEVAGEIDAGPGTAEGGAWDGVTVAVHALRHGDVWQIAARAAVRAPRLRGEAPLATEALASAIGDVAPATGRIRLGGVWVEAAGAALSAQGVVRRWGEAADLVATVRAPVMGGTATVRAVVSGAPGRRYAAQLRMRSRAIASGIPVLDRLLGPEPGARGLAFLGSGGRVRVAGLRIRGARGEARGDGSVAGGRMRLWAAVALPDMAAITATLSGGAVARGRLEGAFADPAAWGIADTAGIAIGRALPITGRVGFDLAHLGRAADGDLALDLTVAGHPLSGGMRLEAGSRTRIDALALASGSTRLTGSLLVVDRKVRGHLVATVPRLAEWGPMDGQATADLVLDPARGQSARLTAATRGLAAAGTVVQAADVAATVTGIDGVPVIQAEATVQGIRRDRLKVARATASATARLEAESRATLQVEGHDMRLGDGPGGIEGRARVELNGRRLAAHAAAHLGHRLTADGDAALALGPDLLPEPGAALSGAVKVAGDVGPLAEALPLAGDSVAGTVTAGLRLSGTVAAPRIAGRVDLTGGRWQNLVAGTVVTRLAAGATFDGETVRLHVEGGDGGDGRMTVDGGGRLAGADTAWRAEATLADFHAVRRDDVDATIAGDLVLTGSGGATRLAGNLRVKRAEVDIGRLAGGGPPSLDVIEINQPRRQTKKKEPAAGPAPAMALAIDVAIDRAFVRGRGLDSEWRGNVAVAGTPARPALTGEVRAVRGSFDLLGRSFRLDPDGAVDFTGNTPVNPSLDVGAEAATKDVTAKIHVGGTARQPEFDIESEPPLPKDEILARVLFGSDAGKLSAFQQLQLAQVAASGLGIGDGGGFNPLGSIRSALGLDVLALGGGESDASGSPTLSLGKYVGEDTFVRVEQGVTGLGKVTVEENVGHGFSLSTSLGQQAGEGLGVTWHLDY